MRCIFFLLLFFSVSGYSQWKDYIIGVKGDTLNRVDKKDQKQGPWVIRYNEVRGEPGFEEEGDFIDNRKEGSWRKYTLMGDLFASENFRWGFKDGTNRYFNLNGDLVKEENWRALNPDKEYDTLDVEDVTNPGNYTTVIVKNEGASLKHGTWKYFDSNSGFATKTEFWQMGKLDESDGIIKAKPKPITDSSTIKKPKPKEVMDFEKKNAGKKKVKVRDGSVGY